MEFDYELRKIKTIINKLFRKCLTLKNQNKKLNDHQTGPKKSITSHEGMLKSTTQ